MISNLVEDPTGNVIGRKVRLKVVAMADGVNLPRFELAD